MDSIHQLLQSNQYEGLQKEKIISGSPINEARILIQKTKNYIGSMNICQLSDDIKITSYSSLDKLRKINYIVIIKTLHNIEPTELFSRLSYLSPIGIGIVYVDDASDEEILIIS